MDDEEENEGVNMRQDGLNMAATRLQYVQKETRLLPAGGRDLRRDELPRAHAAGGLAQPALHQRGLTVQVVWLARHPHGLESRDLCAALCQQRAQDRPVTV